MRYLLRLSCCFLPLLAVSLSVAQPQSAPEPLRLVRMTPTGNDVPVGRQIVFEFNRSVVPVGRMERRAEEIPIAITPPLACSWRWLNTTTLACQLDEQAALQLATRYTVTVYPGISTQDGATLAAEVTHTFLTQRPKVTSTWWHTWHAPGMPELTVVFDQPVTSDSVAQHLSMHVAPQTRVAVRAEVDEHGAGRHWRVRPVAELPLDAHVTLRIEPGIASTQGPEPGTEQRVVMHFDTLPALRFMGIVCVTNAEDEVIIPPGTPLAEQRRCNPMREVQLRFSAPVIKEAVKDVLRVTPDFQQGRPSGNAWEEVYSYSRLSWPHERGKFYDLPLPSPLQAHTIYQLESAPQQIKDEFGRVLDTGITIQFLTDHRPPDYHLNHRISVLEQSVDTHLPLGVTNLDLVHLRYQTLTAKGPQPPQAHTMLVQKPQDVPYTIPLKVRELIPAASGAIQGRLTTTPRVAEPQWFWSQVTPFHVHVKIGHYNTLVWVTRFDTGLPVRDVQVQLTRATFGTFDAQPPVLAEAITNADGVALMPGTSDVDPKLTLLNHWKHDKPRLVVRLQHGDDMAVVPLAPQFQLPASGANNQYIQQSLQQRYGHIRTWGTTPQGVYRAGDTVDFKLYVRDQDNQRFVPAPRAGYTLQVIDPMDKVVHEVKELGLSEFGAYDGAFTAPANGAVGWYRFQLTATFSKNTWVPMRVLISDFTPAPFRVTTDLAGTHFANGDTVAVTTQATLHAGGPYGAAPMRLVAMVEERTLVPEDPRAAGFTFAGSDATTSETLHTTEAVLDDQGTRETTFTIRASEVVYGQLRVESAVQDDRGKHVARLARARYVGRDRYVGLRQEDWVLTAQEPALVQTLVVDDHGIVVAGTDVQVYVEYLETKAARVKGAGNAYVTRYTHEWVEAATCAEVSEDTPGACIFTPKAPGTYRLTASIEDTQGRAHRTSMRRWAIGAGAVLWETPTGHGLQIFPEKTAYQVGDTARYLVQNPFPGAQALVTVERFGVQRSWVQTLADSTAMIEVPVTPDHLPGFYVSVVVMSPRVEQPLGAGQVDLGKPAFRMGYVQTTVEDPYKEILIDVQPRAAVYKPRQTATVDLQVRTRQGDVPPVELAVAVLDEAVFDLIAAGSAYFNPYTGFYTLDALDMWNYNILLRLIGRQKFDKKGANPGGGGGLDMALRSDFKFVSYWNPSIKPDNQGRATVSFTLPDNLTGWRVLALAVTPADRMGLGEGHFKANKPTEIRPALPNQVTAGDRFVANFTIMNRTDTARTLDVTLHATGPMQAQAEVQQTIHAEPFKRYLVSLPVHTTTAGDITLQARAGDSQDHDALALPLTVHRRFALEAAATYGTTTADEVTETIAFPADMRTDMGHVSVVAAPTVIGGLAGAFTYMRDYPYICWEQVLTKGVMAAHYRNLQGYLPDSLQWPESTELPERTLARAANYQAPNGGMAYYLPQEQYVSPSLSAYTALAFNRLRTSGYAIPQPVETQLHAYLQTFLRRDVMPTFYTHGMSSTVRAMALAALAPHAKISRADMLRYQRHLPEMSLFGKAHYLLALTQVPETATLQTEVVTMIRAHANETGGKFIFSEALDQAYQRILASPMRANCAILSAFLAYDGAQPDASDVPFKLTRTITQARKNRDRWENTQENMFCLQALVDFSRIYERETPDLTLQAALDDEPIGAAAFRSHTDAAVDLQRPIQPDDAGRTATLTLARQGQGRVYYATRLFYAPASPKTEPINAGIDVRREYSVERAGRWELLRDPMEIRTGELVRVDLYLSLPAARHFVVVDDPVPGGLEPVNRDLATASTVDADKATVPYAGGAFWWRYNDWYEFGTARWRFYHQELRHRAARFYSEYLPAGRYHLAYVAQAIAPGEFTVLPTHAAEMYDPDTFGQGVPATLQVVRAPDVQAQR